MLLLTAALLMLQSPQVEADPVVAGIFAAERARAGTPAEVATLVAGTRSSDTTVQRLAVRAIGRLERAELLGALEPMLAASAATVRMEAANAVAQAAYRVDGAEALGLLLARQRSEPSAQVQGALLAAAGRLRLGGADAAASVAARGVLAAALDRGGAHLEGALRGTWDLLRKQGRGASAGTALAAALRRWLESAPAPESRRLALMALAAGNAVDSTIVAIGARDDDPQVRRLAVLAARNGSGWGGRNELLRRALRDREVMVRIEAVRGWSSHGRPTEGCEPLLEAVRDPSVTVQLLAIEALGAGCGAMTAPRDLLDAMAREPLSEAGWHRPVAALAALARSDSARAALRLGSFVGHQIWWVRMHAADVAAQLRDRTTLLRLVEDREDNVRDAALRGLIALDGRQADRFALAQLARPDLQLVLNAARALRGSALGTEVASASLDAFRRISRERIETSRDTRMALLDRIAEFGTAVHLPALQPALRDFDPLVAGRVAELATRLGGQQVAAAPAPIARAALPEIAALRGMTGAVLVMEGGARLMLALRPLEAPGSVARFVAMAESGWFNGRTLHRVVPNFVLQGGSPGANEYVGGADFSPDEVGGSHRRGTIGISTRGRDTGDGQIFINLVDNLNLDHEYTVIGTITGDLAPIDEVQEGAVILRVEIQRARPTGAGAESGGPGASGDESLDLRRPADGPTVRAPRGI